MESVELDAGAIVAVLEAHQVRYVLIGGLAAIVHGSPFNTEDLDLTPERSRDNLARLSAALRELGAKTRAAELDEPLPFNHDADSLGAVMIWNLHTSAGILDISMKPSGTDGFDDLVRDASAVEVFGHRVLVASLADVVRSKQAANRPKDQRVLPTLREILARRLDEGREPRQ
jgi:hypothetical protein